MAAVEVFLLVEEVHRSAFAAAAAGYFSEQFCHYCFGIHADSECVAVVSVGGYYVISGEVDGCDGAGAYCFLSNVYVAKAADFAEAVHLGGLFFEPAYQEHLAK